MSIVNGMITAPVNIYDIRRILGINDGDLGTVITNGSINMWARYKPQRNSRFRNLTHGTLTHEGNTRKADNFGIQVPYCGRCLMNNKVHLIMDGDESEDWQYLRPRGDRTAQGEGIERFRINDFVRIPSDSSDPTPSSLTGYDHNAPVPFTVSLNKSGLTPRYDADGDYYEVNVQEVNSLVFTFGNSAGYNLHLQDLVDNTKSTSDGKNWRPVLQVFYAKYIDARATQWYERNTADEEIVGNAIPSDITTPFTISLDVTALSKTAAVDDFYHLCIGVGFCSQTTPVIYDSNNESLFILPRSEYQKMTGVYPFYYRFTVVSYFNSDRLRFTNLEWFNTGTTRYVSAVKDGTTFTVSWDADNNIWLTMTIKKALIPMQFVGENGTAISGYTAFRIRVKESISGEGSETTRYLIPQKVVSGNYVNDDPASPTALIPAGSPSETVTLYALIDGADIGNIPYDSPNGGYATYHAQASVGTAGFDNISSFSIHKTPNPNI